ncbi:probable sodium/metabolite cotransporter BASS4, chloroplastic isoform X2 [Amborella trichopoda]|uniref:Probable sodium/metabolite cotransporter BASS4, chloroplastic n=1 Tax=Amborella trichopoda TaxID=13333 RepID=W1NUG5_AMBTC|nr:probable sodium/metabolite cotransporter BASS4, chloroplastic isoform X2 [Amborella trichopoda]ERM98915.1 hypothetical protein AMTR_s00114p00090820 [Amborella trichopoda]|eukprot:XP_011620662.2 probable sodium/metabolite cotransporter BASS4, chloroplastic isoform X2 [Amborella trichopoda]
MVAGAAQTLSFKIAISGNGSSSNGKPYFSLNNSFTSAFPLVLNPNSLHLYCSYRPYSFISFKRIYRVVGRPSQAGDGDIPHLSNSKLETILSWGRPVLEFITRNFLPLALLSGISLGLANPSLGCLAHKYSVTKWSTFGIFLISGLTLRTRDITAAVKAWPEGAFGLCSILFFTPFFSKLILQLELIPQEFIRGLAIFCCMPTTLSSGVALTQLVGGNSALALAVTVSSNLLGTLTVPLFLSRLVAKGVGISVPIKELLMSLVVTLLGPLILGQGLRFAFRSVAEYVDNNRRFFSMMNSVILSLVPWIQVSRSRSLLLLVRPAVFLIAIGLATFLHVAFLTWNSVAIQCLKVVSGGRASVFEKKENARAVTLVASQKTLPVMVAVVEQLGGALGEPGLLVLPCVAAHINQIIFDSFLVNYWLQKDENIKTA